MNTNKQINIIILLVFISVIATGAYTLWDPDRADSAKVEQREKAVERGAWLFSQNCRVCHGDAGEGGAASNRLRAAPALNGFAWQGRESEDGEVDETERDIRFKLAVNTITCGRVGRAMPVWGQSQGGPLNDEQIRQLATLITEGGHGWDIAKEFAIEGAPKFDKHGDDGDGFRLAEPLSEDATEVRLLGPVDALAEGLRLQIGEELLLVNGAPVFDAEAETVTEGTVPVERGVGTTNAEAHDTDAEILRPPVPPASPVPTVQASCGQTAGAPTTDGPAEAPSATLSITAQGTAWNKNRLSAIAGVPLTISVDNKDDGTAHNIHFTVGAEPGGPELEPAALTDIEPGPVVQTLNFGPLAAGEYYYLCDVHPSMEGVLTASEPGAAPAAGTTTVPATSPDAGVTPAGGTTPQAGQTPTP